MKVCLAVWLFFPLLAGGQAITAVAPGQTKLEYYLAAYSHADGTKASTAKISGFVKKMESNKNSARTEKDFLAMLFSKTHRQFLKSYTDYASFGETLESGSYNCLTGTALYALILDHLQINYRIIETNYHIFLLAGNSDENVLIEATDPKQGFITDQARISERITHYKQNTAMRSGSTKKFYKYESELYNEVNLDEMLGLLHYNLSIVAYNHHDLPTAIDQLREAMALYHSVRIEEFARLIHLTVIESTLEPSVKSRCLSEIQQLRRGQNNLSARTN